LPVCGEDRRGESESTQPPFDRSNSVDAGFLYCFLVGKAAFECVHLLSQHYRDAYILLEIEIVGELDLR